MIIPELRSAYVAQGHGRRRQKGAMACPDSASRPFWRRHRAAVDEPGTGDGGGTDEGELWDGAANRRPADPSACPRASPHARAPPPAHIEHAIAKYGCKEQRRKNRREAQNEGRVLLCERRAANRLAPDGLWVSNRMDVSRSCDSLLWSSSPLMTSVRPPRSSPGVVAGVAGLCGVVAHALSAEEADSGSGKARQRAAGRPGA